MPRLVSQLAYLCAISLCAAAQSLAAQTPALPQAQQAPSEKPPVEVYVTATQAPTLSDLTVLIDKSPAQVTAVRSAKDEKLLFAIVMDASLSQRKYAPSEKAVAGELFQALNSNGNHGFLTLFNTKATVTRIIGTTEAQSVLNKASFEGGSSIYDAIAETCLWMTKLPENATTPRKAIILLSDGDDNQSRFTPEKAEAAAANTGAVIFSLTITSSEHAGQRFLDRAAQSTGGQSVTMDQLEAGVKPLLAAINKQWVLTLQPVQPGDGKRHALIIKDANKRANLSAPASILLP